MNRPTEGIATDAAHSMKRGITRYRGIDLKTGEEVFYGDIGNQTVNIGEFLGVVEAIKYIIEHNYLPRTIYTDSTTAISWLKQKQTASKKRLPALFKAEAFLQIMSVEIDTINVLHWNNEQWGETPADFNQFPK